MKPSVLLICTLAISILFPTLALAQSVPVSELPIGSPGWQPNARTFLFNVPFYRQEKRLTCELASLRSALAGIGIQVSEWDLWARVRKDFTPRVKQKDGSIVWGDPNKGFVGLPNGRMPTTGYGVFRDPIAELANWYATSSKIRVDDPAAIDAALKQGHPIVIWSVIGTGPYITNWKTPAGNMINAPVREHTRVIVGYRGDGKMIEGIYLIDPLTGLQYLPWNDFHAMNAMFDHAGLEVMKEMRSER